MSRTYKTKQGDSWDLIAYQQRGGCQYTKDLMWANRGLLDYYTCPAGVIVTIPEITKVSASTLPPWKKVST